MSASIKIPWGYQILQQTYSGRNEQTKIRIKFEGETDPKGYQTTV